MANLEEVFRLAGVPTYTFVEPLRYGAIKVAVRTPGRCVVLEGPSGIGKTTTVTQIVENLGKGGEIIQLSARRPADIDMISALPDMGKIGTVVIDDFHRLTDEVKSKLSDYMKLLADTSDEHSQLVLIGINKAGDQLVQVAHDLGLRIDIFKMEANPPDKVEELIAKGADALNVRFLDNSQIANAAQGSFHIAQVLCHYICVEAEITETQETLTEIDVSVDVVIDRVMADLGRQFMTPSLVFAGGSKIRREGRAPYLHILKWLSESDDWSLDLAELLRLHPEHKGSIGQVIKKGHLEALLRDKSEVLGHHFHYEPSTRVLSVEDPKLIFFLRNLVWRNFTRKAGFATDYFKGAYDFALSFAGNQREIAHELHNILEEREVSVFYDHNEQHRIIARNVEDYLGPIYRTEARYVVPILSAEYPTRIWTKFESDQFRQRFGEEAVIPVRLTDVREGFFSEERNYGGLAFDPAGDQTAQLRAIADILCARLEEDREKADVEADEAAQVEASAANDS
ncbi:MAG: hypothetical protein PSV23_12600 [Brevundimonas sp.]|uniref:TIR domain-containing protein n=1 Tax=Brevundimonas sp. TaxID=1871086 RepID=UPI00248A384C|nr:TIR domain-containing protein [Brevundimonas sp.]MDI1327624.1 hypothetical protein [Brevundimonas sp.]